MYTSDLKSVQRIENHSLRTVSKFVYTSYSNAHENLFKTLSKGVMCYCSQRTFRNIKTAFKLLDTSIF